MMNLGPPPPPPPPPFSTGTPTPTPARAPTEVPSKAPLPTVGPPAALAGAMLKDKKPFTYTPGGINLAEINAQVNPQANGGTHAANFVGTQEPAMQSRSFKVIQNAYDNQDTTGTPAQDVLPEPKKYTGSNIPSRSFRMLQAMTDNSDVQSDDSNVTSQLGKASQEEENASQPETSFPISKSSTNNSNYIYSPSSSCSSLAPPSVASSDMPKDIGSQVAPSYTSTSDSHVYRQVVPTIASKARTDRVVNTALSAKRDASPRPWQRTSRDSSPTRVVRSSSLGVDGSVSSPTDLESSSRLLNIIKQETTESEGEVHEPKLLYEGSHIPSRVFRQLQSDYSSNNSNEGSRSGSTTPCSKRVTEVHIPRIMQQLRIDQKSGSSDRINFDQDQYLNGVSDTASAKESVLKELTSQFDPQTQLKKPKAAPGRVFRYLQQQYDEPQDSDFASMDSGLNSNNTSPNHCSSTTSSGIDTNQYEIEAKPYGGGRIPGRTFKLLQEHTESHPSVFQARK